MPAICGVCHEAESKYRCPKCETRYCSVACNRIHKPVHEDEASTNPALTAAGRPQDSAVQDSKSTNQQDDKSKSHENSKFDGFENDAEFRRLLTRYPYLRYQIQLVYGITIEPGPEDAYTWGKQKWFDDGSAPQRPKTFRGRGGRGRGGFRGGYQGGRGNIADELPVDERQHGPWTQVKADKQGLDLIKKLREVNHVELSEGMREFTKLCAIRFGG
ncbi:hypothetical protein CB0940_00538 [Cercospora beticola]|uniref:HIT-type domain-containing protein n=1 Tax=Cercospora beticola TaxID=122368 RepID=A0A2G5IBQ6_CERBT|nr:hypothetical protein CB0940_00538 [Cercospora beticola]PIB02209.1 hypothetical protein CB0940_00538 [Cercospora beticola]WPA95957.1 hypothetical protein RHO25_000562 [Cercospora beticola]CAK1355774.1 unnamed protein product [Cercospora beticola]